MGSFSESISTVMREFVGMCQTPVIVLLLLCIVFIAGCIGWIIGEAIVEHRHFRVVLPRLVDDLRASSASAEATRQVIVDSGLLMRQKRYLLELTRHPDVTDAMRESLAVGLEDREQRRYDIITKITDITARVSPMLGLLGTLIPLGPGIMALGMGDTETLSQSLLTAFDTTSLGLIVAVFALIISAIRRRWYRDYMVSFDAAMECVLEVEALRKKEAPNEMEAAK